MIAVPPPWQPRMVAVGREFWTDRSRFHLAAQMICGPSRNVCLLENDKRLGAELNSIAIADQRLRERAN